MVIPCFTASLVSSVGVKVRNILNLSWFVRASLMIAKETMVKPRARQQERMWLMSPVKVPITTKSGETWRWRGRGSGRGWGKEVVMSGMRCRVLRDQYSEE